MLAGVGKKIGKWGPPELRGELGGEREEMLLDARGVTGLGNAVEKRGTGGPPELRGEAGGEREIGGMI